MSALAEDPRYQLLTATLVENRSWNSSKSALTGSRPDAPRLQHSGRSQSRSRAHSGSRRVRPRRLRGAGSKDGTIPGVSGSTCAPPITSQIRPCRSYLSRDYSRSCLGRRIFQPLTAHSPVLAFNPFSEGSTANSLWMSWEPMTVSRWGSLAICSPSPSAPAAWSGYRPPLQGGAGAGRQFFIERRFEPRKCKAKWTDIAVGRPGDRLQTHQPYCCPAERRRRPWQRLRLQSL